jgi:two-component system, NarL family, nitrate/nitrite response regulator NarL
MSQAESSEGHGEAARKILVYGRQAFASHAFCEMLAKEFPDRTVTDTNSREGLSSLDPNVVDLVVVTTSAAANVEDMNELGSMLQAAEVRPVLAILGDIGFAAKPEQAERLNLRGVFPDQTHPNVVLAGLRFILAGGKYFPTESTGDVAIEQSNNVTPGSTVEHAQENEESGSPSHVFTTRELAVLKCIARGLSNKAISRELGIAENTIKIHVRGILRKLDCSNRTEAALHAQRLALVTSP